MKRYFSLAVLMILLVACGNSEEVLEKHVGVIVSMEILEEQDSPTDGWYELIVISNVDKEQYEGKSMEQLINLAQKNNGAFYLVNSDDVTELNLEVGQDLALYYDSQGDSDPPVREPKKIEVIQK